MKQIIEIILSILALLFLSPLFILIAFLIYIEDRGSIFFLQERVGLREIPFQILKFRTMKEGSITKIGSVLRRTGLDELPQLFNILSGDMSIVGPRPLTRLDIKRLGWNQYRYISRWNIKPGITGLAQLYAGRSARISICFDLSYVKTYNLILDFKIILLTILMNVLGKKTIRRILNEKIKSRTRIMNWSKWKKYFYKNSFSKLPEIHDSLDRMNSEQKLALQKSLAIFQLGEAGEGRIAKEIYKTNIFAVNQNYRECIEYFVKEEGKHARILSKIIFTLGGRLLEKNWTEKLFSLGRRLLGIRLKLIVLLVAELVSLVFYKFYIQKLPLSGIRAALIGILKEEEKHLEFHSNFFKIRLNHFVSRNTFKILFFIISHSAFLVILLDHFRYLKKFNAGLIELYIQFLQVYDLVESKVFEREKTIDSINKFSTGALK